MLLIITSDCKSLTDKDPTFICTRKISRFPYINKYKYIYNIFSGSVKQYTNSERNEFKLFNITDPSLKHNLSALAKMIKNSVDRSPELIDELTLICACERSINKNITRKLNEELAKNNPNYTIKANDIYQFLKFPSKDRLKDTLKNILNIQDFDMDDPYMLGFCLVEALDRK